MHAVPLPPHSTLKRGQYRVQRHIATGGFGAVYLATNAAGASFAIKESFDANYVCRVNDGLKVTARDDVPNSARIHERQRQRAREEFERFSQPHLKHPALVPLLDCFDEFGTTYLVMPYIEGQDLRQAALQRRGGDAAWVLQLLRSIGDVLALLHKHGLIHRDLKPDNILVCTDSKGAIRPVVLDTGATRDYSRADRQSTGLTTDFGAPEIASAADARIYGRPGPASDCFAMAGMACLLLSGEKPLGNRERAAAMMRAGATDPLRQPSGVSSAVWQVLRRSLQLQVAQRHQSADDFLAELQTAMNLRPADQQVQPAAASRQAPTDTPVAMPVVMPVVAPAVNASPSLGKPDAIAWLGALMALGAVLVAAWLLWGAQAAAVTAAGGLCLHLTLALVLLLRGVAPAWALFPVGNLLELLRLGRGGGRQAAQRDAQ